MNALSQFLGTVEGDYPSPMDGSEPGTITDAARFQVRFEDWSLTAKLRLIVFGVAIIPFLVASLLLIQFAYFGQSGSDHAERVRAEVLVSEAALAMAQTASDLDEAQEQQSETMLVSAKERAAEARDKLTRAIILGEGHYPQEIITRFEQARDEIAAKTTIIEGLSLSSVREMSEIQSYARRCADGLAAIFADARTFAIAAMDSMLESIVIGFAVCVGLILGAIAASILGARVMIAHVVGQIADITGAMETSRTETLMLRFRAATVRMKLGRWPALLVCSGQKLWPCET